MFKSIHAVLALSFLCASLGAYAQEVPPPPDPPANTDDIANVDVFGHGDPRTSQAELEELLQYIRSLAPAPSDTDTVKVPAPSQRRKPCPHGDPVDTLTGFETLSQQDVSGAGEMPLEFIRTYNGGRVATTNPPAGGLSYGWYSSIDEYLGFVSGNVHAGLQSIGWGRSDGAIFTYRWNSAQGRWAAEQSPSWIYQSGSNWILNSDDNTIYTFNASGQLLSKTKYGVGWTLLRDTNNHVYRVNHSSGRHIDITWAGNVITSITDPNGAIITYGYTVVKGMQMLSLVTYANGDKTNYYYENSYFGTLLTGYGFNGIRYSTISYYDNRAFVKSTALAGGVESTTFARSTSPDGMLVTNASGMSSVFTRTTSPAGGLLPTGETRSGVTGCSNGVSQMLYDSNGTLYETKEWSGTTHDFVFDSYGHVSNERVGVGSVYRTIDYIWDQSENQLLIKNLLDSTNSSSGYNRTDYAYYPVGTAAAGRLWKVTDTDTYAASPTFGHQRVETYTYSFNTNGIPSSIARSGPVSGQTETWSFDAKGNLTSHSNALSQATTYSNYNEYGSPGLVIDANGLATTYSYDQRGRLSSVAQTIDGSARATSYAYDRFGNVSKITYPASEVNFLYDDANRLQRKWYSSDPLQVETWVFSNLSKLLFHNIYPPSGNASFYETWTYDEAGRKKTYTGAKGTITYTYFDAGNPQIARESDALGHTKDFHYNPFGEVDKITFTDGKHRDITRNGLGLVSSVTDPRANASATTLYGYDGFGNPVSMSSPDKGNVQYGYDLSGNRTSMLQADGNSVNYQYDLLNRTTAITASSASRTYTYDNCDNGVGKICKIVENPCPSGSALTCALSGNVTEKYTYGSNGKLVKQESSGAGATYTTKWTYDSMDRVSTLTYPGGNLLTYSYDGRSEPTRATVDLGLLSPVKDVVSSVTYAPSGPPTGIIFGNGSTQSIQYDTSYRPIDIASAATQHIAIGYDSVGRINAITDYVNSSYNKTFGYNQQNMLTSMVLSPVGETWVYDANGNRTQHFIGADQDIYTVDSSGNLLNAITGTHPTTFSYDDNGNVSAKSGSLGTQAYSYNAFQELSTVTTTDGTVDYFYNGLGQRIKKSGFGFGTFHFDYDPDGHLLSETAKNGISAKRNYVWLHNQLVAVIDGSDIYAVLNDESGRPEALLDSNKAVVWRANNKPFDRIVTNSSFGDLNIGFPGQYYDNETGLWYNWHRYYDADTGRYLQPDPMGFVGGANPYSYANNDPLLTSDFDGLESPTVSMMGLPQEDPRGPDFIIFNIDIYVASFTGAYSRYGNSYAGWGTNRGVAYGKNYDPKPGVMIAAGWVLNDPCPDAAKIDSILAGYSNGFNVYLGAGGGVIWSPGNGEAMTMGAGFSIGPSLGGVNYLQGDTGIRW